MNMGFLLAIAQSPMTIAVVVVISMIVYGGLGWFVLVGYRWFKRAARTAQERAFEGLEISLEPEEGYVHVTFGAYFGFLGFVDQTVYDFWAPPEDAREVLGRLHRCSLIWAMFAYGALIIPLFTFMNYLGQRRSIRQQEQVEIDRHFSGRANRN